MIYFRSAIYSVLFASLLGLSACGMTPKTSSSATHPNQLTAHLTGASEVPATGSKGSGTVEAELNKQTKLLSWTVTYSGLSGPATAAHFHGPALAGTNAGPAVPLSGSLTSPIKGTATLTATQVSDLMAGKWYLNVHTAAHPDGEIRGQVSAQP